MKCQAWVDPAKFNKKGLPTPRSVLGTYALDPLSPGALKHFNKGTKAYEKQEAALNRAVRCGGQVEFWMGAEYDEGGSTGGIETTLECAHCREQVHELKIDSELVEQWIQERLNQGE